MFLIAKIAVHKISKLYEQLVFEDLVHMNYI